MIIVTMPDYRCVLVPCGATLLSLTGMTQRNGGGEGEASLGLLGELSQKRRNEIIQRSKNRKGVLGTGAGPAEAGKQFDFAGA